jgi:GNAT superfamily N-acetyltransferase
MKIHMKQWNEVEETKLEELFLNSPFPLYRGTPLGNELMKKYMFILAREAAEVNKENAMVALDHGNPLVLGQVYPVPYLSDFWGISVGTLGHLVVNNPTSKRTHEAAVALTSALVNLARDDGMAFLSASVPGPSIALARALEKNAFVYAEGFINMVGPTNKVRKKFRVPGLRIRNPIEKDFHSIADAYAKVQFPSRFVTDGGFDPNKAQDLYVRRYREVFEEKIGKIFIGELKNEFVGALIAIVDEKMAKTIGIKTNVLSGMGIIVHPRAARKGISMALIDHRQEYYKSQGVEHVNFGANFNNGPMILGLSKLGLRYGSLDMAFHLWLK